MKSLRRPRRPKTHEQTSCPTEPTSLTLTDNSMTFDVTSTAINNVVGKKAVTRKSGSIFLTDSRNPKCRLTTIYKILWHDHRDALFNVIRRVKLTTEGTSLYRATTSMRLFCQSAHLPPHRNLAEFGIDEAVGEEGEEVGG